jgi:hypothetical protein
MDSSENKDELNGRNVRALKIFFQNQKLPIMGMPDNSLNNDLTISPLDSSSNRTVVRPNRVIPRPPKPIQCSDINVSSLMKVLPTNQTERPVPKPRKSLQINKNNTNCDQNSDNTNCDNNQFISDSNNRSNSLTLSTIKEFKELSLNGLNGRNVKSHSISLPQNSSSIVTNDRNSCQTSNPNCNEVCAQTTDKTVMNSSNEPNSQKLTTNDKQRVSKTKKQLKSFLKRSKILSLRRSSAENKKEKSKLCATNSDPSSVIKQLPIKPTRSPPLPPLLRFRPAAPLPPEANEDYYEDTLTASNSSGYKHPYELYNDSAHDEQIYCSLDNDDDSETDFYEGIDDYDDGLTGHKHSYIADNYYEDSFDNMNSDCDRIYEVLPFEKEYYSDSDSNASIVSLEEKQINSDCDPLAKKRELKAIKLRKKFNMTGEEVPVNAGIVKEDKRGSRYDLYVREGETVLILRMEGNPPGKWLAKNERAKVGYVDLANISFDPESVKSIIKTLSNNNS